MMKKVVMSIVIVLAVAGISFAVDLYDDFSTDPNVNWTTNVTGSDILDLNAFTPYSDGPYAYNYHNGGNVSEMKTAISPTGQYRISFDFNYAYGSSSCWAEFIQIGTDTDNIRIDLFPSNRNSGGNYFFIKTIVSGATTTQLESAIHTSGWDHYELLIDTVAGEVTVTRWDRDFSLDDDPAAYGNKPVEDIIVTTTFSFTFAASGNEVKMFNATSSGTGATVFDNVLMDEVPTPVALYDNFSTDPNTNWTTTVAGTDTLDLYASQSEYSWLPDDGTYVYHAHSGSNTSEMRTALMPGGLYRVSFDFNYIYGSSGCWSERIQIGTDRTYVYIDLFPSTRNSGGNYFFVKTYVSETTTTQLENAIHTSGWDHYELLIDTAAGEVTVTRWDRDFSLDANPAAYGNKPVEDIIVTTTFSFTFNSTWNEFKVWNGSSGSSTAQVLLDNVWMQEQPPPQGTLIIIN